MNTRLCGYFFAVAGALASTGLAGCGSTQSIRQTEGAGHKHLTVVAVDTSKSTEWFRNQALSTAFQIGSKVGGDDDLLVLRFASQCEEIETGPPTDDDGFSLRLKKELGPSDPKPKTNYPRMLARVADIVASSKDAEVDVYVLGDAGNDFEDARWIQRYVEAAKRLESDPRVKEITFWGVEAGTREEVRSIFSDKSGKLRLLNSDQDPEGMAQ